MLKRVSFLAFAVATFLGAGRLVAQTTRADTAAILVETARRLEAAGERDAANGVLRYVLRNYADTDAGRAAAGMMDVYAAEPAPAGSGRTQLIAWSTLYGAWLGIAVPAMLGADGGEAYGVGLLLGGPVGFGASRSYAVRARPTDGEAGAAVFGFRWGSWQAAGWRAVFEIGNRTSNCYGDCAGRSPWTALVLGGVTGMAAGGVIGHRVQPSSGAVAFASHGAYWGTYFGAALADFTDTGGDNALMLVLAAGDAGLLAGAMATPRGVTAGRVWATSALGIAGLAAGFGVDLIVKPDNDKMVLAIPTALGAAALIAGWRWTADMDRRWRPTGGPDAQLINPTLRPSFAVLGENARGRRVVRPALELSLVHGSF